MIPQYTDLTYFIAIAEAKNLSRASERLGVVQPTLSQAVKRLEDATGVPLLIRGKNGVQLTRAGEILKSQAVDLINSWQFLMNDVKEAELFPKGHFVLGAHPSVAIYALGKFLPQLFKDYPMIEVSLVHGLSRELLEDVVSSRIDFGLIMNARRHPDLVLKKICEDKVGFWHAGAHADSSMLISDPSLHQTHQLLKKTKKLHHFQRQTSTSSLEVAAKLTADGVGVGILPERVAKQHSLKPLSQLPWFFDELFLCYRQDRQKSMASKKLIEAILKAKI